MQTNNDSIKRTSLVLFRTLHGYEITPVSLITALITAIVGVVIVLFNAVVLHAIRRSKKGGTSTNIFVPNMATADMLTGIIVIYNVTNNILHYQIFEECVFRNNTIFAVLIASAFSCIGLTFDRYFNIIYPLKYRKVTRRQLTVVCVVMWVTAVVFAYSPLFLVWMAERPPTYLQCGLFLVLERWYIAACISLSYFLPFVVLVTLYTRIFIVVRQQARLRRERASIGSVSGGSAGSVMAPETRKFTKTVTIILLLFFLCWLPSIVVIMAVLAGYLDDRSVVEQGDYLQYGAALGFINSMLNPLVYATQLTHIRVHFCRILCCCRHPTDRRVSSHSAGRSSKSVSVTSQARPTNSETMTSSPGPTNSETVTSSPRI